MKSYKNKTDRLTGNSRCGIYQAAGGEFSGNEDDFPLKEPRELLPVPFCFRTVGKSRGENGQVASLNVY
ncbi:hypothetical protein B1H10_07760 [candidate division KSB1 bacterium 4484_188]|nr:MAG: hypothetical protein B1H10_07760 [candidate division KSB1 bacterium 4484_188]